MIDIYLKKIFVLKSPRCTQPPDLYHIMKKTRLVLFHLISHNEIPVALLQSQRIVRNPLLCTFEIKKIHVCIKSSSLHWVYIWCELFLYVKSAEFHYYKWLQQKVNTIYINKWSEPWFFVLCFRGELFSLIFPTSVSWRRFSAGSVGTPASTSLQ